VALQKQRKINKRKDRKKGLVLEGGKKKIRISEMGGGTLSRIKKGAGLKEGYRRWTKKA